MEKKQIAIPTTPVQKSQKTAKKTSLFAKIAGWSCLVGIFPLFLSFPLEQSILQAPLMYAFVIAEIAAFVSGLVGVFHIMFSKAKLKGYDYSLVGFFIPLILSVIVPNFLRFEARSTQSEAKGNLLAIYTAYQAYHSNYNTYPSSFSIQVGNTAYNCLSITGWEPIICSKKVQL